MRTHPVLPQHAQQSSCTWRLDGASTCPCRYMHYELFSHGKSCTAFTGIRYSLLVHLKAYPLPCSAQSASDRLQCDCLYSVLVPRSTIHAEQSSFCSKFVRVILFRMLCTALNAINTSPGLPAQLLQPVAHCMYTVLIATLKYSAPAEELILHCVINNRRYRGDHARKKVVCTGSCSLFGLVTPSAESCHP